ncbi:beta-L-arabinofuranosidase domain-containing protein [Chitinophaga sp.]|uniref:beta-L-arabinofuranosidase domain-containing protein n=1 Tax=Chitinophaga sp. TaxID=1869181 RepID=UPI002CBAEC18|nr:beta-L-arabinofuranosidase domain-containing protein [Chitinophaga sp.]HWV67193.1 beta-L-arabinofuranosidase domain-containing protein [Chitinophaga sp.]
MKHFAIASAMLLGFTIQTMAQGKKNTAVVPHYYNNRAPLHTKPYTMLPLGAITPQGWLRTVLVQQKNGATGQLDKLYPLVMNQRNGWLGGDGDQWERGPYWIDGLLPLAYLLKDEALIAKVKPWVEWSIKSQQPDGYFGPGKDYPYEAGIQRDNSHDWWPKMVMLKVLKQYYDATADPRIIKLMTNYFRYQLKELPQKPLDHWTFWAKYRAGDNLAVVYWLYNITGDAFLLDLAEVIHKQTFDYTNAFMHTPLLSTTGSIHGVNLAQGIKEPMIYFQQHPDSLYRKATAKGFDDLRTFNGMANGLYGGDEALHGNNPTQGSELCSAVEMMFSLESILEISGEVRYADQLEKIAFNVLPSQITEDFMTRQYFQQSNQVMATRHIRNFDVNHSGTDLCYGLLSGYACCTSNMHQGWPKFAQNLWYATADSGVAALLYAPSEVKVYVAGQTPVTVKEVTNYPFEEAVTFNISTPKKVSFPFHLRIPAWCKQATVKVNGKVWQEAAGNQVVKVERTWQQGDVVELALPMHIYKEHWFENSISVERGPVTYALKIGEAITTVKNDKDALDYGDSYREVRPTTPWNYALIATPDDKLATRYRVEKNDHKSAWPWSLEHAPISLKTTAKRIPSWKLYNEMTGPIPYSITYGMETGEEEEITLVPFGCTKLRISQFPVVNGR